MSKSIALQLQDALYAEKDKVLAEDDYSSAHVFELSVDLADSLSKGVSPVVWLPRYQEVMLENCSRASQDEVEAYQTVLMYCELLLEEVKNYS